MRDNLIQQIAQPKALRRGDCKHLANAQLIKIIDGFLVRLRLHFVNDDDHRLFCPAQHLGHLKIRGHQPLFCIHKKQDDIRRLHGELCLQPHLL